MRYNLLLQILAIGLLVTVLIVTPALTQWSANPDSNTAICTETGGQSLPVVASDGSGGVIVTWEDSRSGINDDIYAQRVNASGDVQWTADGVAICTATGNQEEVAIVSDGSGGAIITWQDHRGGSNYDIYAQRVNSSGAVQWTADGVAICTAAGDQNYPTLVSDGSGGAIITWWDGRSGGFDIYAQRVGTSGAVQWTANGVAICTASGSQLSPTIVSDGSGGAIITWTDWRDGNGDIYAQRVDTSGAVQWTADGVAICTETHFQNVPAITSDGSGGAIITWWDQRSGSFDIYAQRVDTLGVVQWTANGVAICTSSNDQEYPALVSDGSGGAIITWEDERSGVNWDIYAQRVDASGVVQWTANGVAICTFLNGQEYPTIVSDGSGGAIITWQDPRVAYANVDIYAQRVNTSGTVQWTADGVAICTATGNQGYPTIVSDASGGAIITWHDLRNGNYDVYAQHVAADGALPIQLASLTATTLTTGVQLEWTTLSETNSQGFYVERRPKNTGAYATVSDLIPGAGTSLQEHHYQWTDTKVTDGNYNYRLKLVDLNGAYTYSNAITVAVSGVLGVDDPKLLPTEFALQQNYPNPFNPTTDFQFSIANLQLTTLRVYDLLGKEVATLVNEMKQPGEYRVTWDATNFPSGLYFYKLTAGKYTSVRKMVLIK